MLSDIECNIQDVWGRTSGRKFLGFFIPDCPAQPKKVQ